MWTGRELERKVARALDCIGKGAAALSEAGTTVFHMSNAIQKQGLAGLLQSGWQDDTDDSPSAPFRTTKVKSKPVAFEPQDHEEKRAIVQLRLERAMAEQNISRVQQLSRELDELEGCSARNAPSGGCQPARFAIDSEPNGPHVDTRTCRESHTTNVNVSSATVHPDARLPSNIPSSRGAGVRAQHECMCTTVRDAKDVVPSHHCCSVSLCSHRQCCTRSEHQYRQPFDVPGHDRTGDALHFGTTTFSLRHPNLVASVDGNWMAPPMTSSSALYGMHNPADNRTTPICPGMPWSQPPVVSKQSSNRAEAMHLENMDYTALSSMRRNLLNSSCNPNGVVLRGAVPELHHSHGITLLPGRRDSMSHLAQTTTATSSVPSQAKCASDAERPLLLTMRCTTALCREATHESEEEESPTKDDAQDEANMDKESKQSKHKQYQHMQDEHVQDEHMQQEEDSLGDFDIENGGDEEAHNANVWCEHKSHLALPQIQSAVQSMATPEKQHQPEVHREITGQDTSDTIGLPPLPDIYEVEKVLDVRTTADGKREFLIKWTGWGPSFNNWEPENHILDKRLLRKFNKKKREETDPPEQAATASITIHSKRRCAKAATIKARATAEAEEL